MVDGDHILPVCIMNARDMSTIAVNMITPSVTPRGIPGAGAATVVEGDRVTWTTAVVVGVVDVVAVAKVVSVTVVVVAADLTVVVTLQGGQGPPQSTPASP